MAESEATITALDYGKDDEPLADNMWTVQIFQTSRKVIVFKAWDRTIAAQKQ